jgi:hypothetical protein
LFTRFALVRRARIEHADGMTTRLVGLAAMLATGCSVFAVSTPSQRPAPPLSCKTTSAAPPADAIAGGLALLLGGGVIYDDLHSRSEYSGLATVYLGFPLLGVGALYGLSATYGFVQTSRCRRFHRELAAAK